MSERGRAVNCVDLAIDFVNTLADCRIGNVQLFGGVGSAALNHPKTEVLADQKLILAPADLFLPQYRPDGNKRDLDCLVQTTDKFEVQEVARIAEASVGDELEVSVFGLKTIAQLDRRRSILPLGVVTMAVSDRYTDENTYGLIEPRKSTLIADADMPPETLETWNLKIGETDLNIPVPHPGSVILNYLTRSLSGLRAKDASKVHALTANIVAKAPEILDWITDGPGMQQLELARILHTLREPQGKARSLGVGGVLSVETYDLADLRNHPALAISKRPLLRSAIIGLEHGVAQAMFFYERRPLAVARWQKYVEPHIKALVGNS